MFTNKSTRKLKILVSNSAEAVLLGNGLIHESVISLLQPLGAGQCSVSFPRTLQSEDCRGRGWNHRPSEPQQAQHYFFTWWSWWLQTRSVLTFHTSHTHNLMILHAVLSWISSTRGCAGFRFTLLFQSYINKPNQRASQTYDLQNFYALPAMMARSANNKSDSLVLWLGAENLQSQNGLMQDSRSTFACFRVIDEDCSFQNLTSRVKNATEDVEKWLDGRGDTFLWFLLKRLRIYCYSIVL